jgi:hypothetical protein
MAHNDVTVTNEALAIELKGLAVTLAGATASLAEVKSILSGLSNTFVPREVYEPRLAAVDRHIGVIAKDMADIRSQLSDEISKLNNQHIMRTWMLGIGAAVAGSIMTVLILSFLERLR